MIIDIFSSVIRKPIPKFKNGNALQSEAITILIAVSIADTVNIFTFFFILKTKNLLFLSLSYSKGKEG